MTSPPHLEVDPAIARGIAEALESTGHYSTEYEVLRQAASGSRMNYQLAVVDNQDDCPAFVWCRATSSSVDGAFADRFTLAREAHILRRLARHGAHVPDVLATSRDGLVMLQRYVDEDTTRAGAHVISRYMRALDDVHALPLEAALPDDEVVSGTTAFDEVKRERDAWLDLASEAVERCPQSLTMQSVPGLADLRSRLHRIVEHLRVTPLPDAGEAATLVHGDAGRANFVVDSDDRIWLIDWELSHAGHRYEDYAWIELRGLEHESSAWCDEVTARVAADGAAAVETYRYFRSMIYFRSVIAITARILASPDHEFVPYLARRLVENEHLGWLSAARTCEVPASSPVLDPRRLLAWHAWSDELDLAERGAPRNRKGPSRS